MKLFDIADDLRYKSHINHGMNHLDARLKIYNNERFPYKIFSIQLPKESNEKTIQDSKNEIG